MDPATAHILPYLVPFLFILLLVRRSLRTRALRVERLWIYPAVLILIGGALLFAQPPETPLTASIDVASVAAGAIIGWWRGRLTRIMVDPETHNLTSRPSIAGLILIVGLFAVRYGLRIYLAQNADAAGSGGLRSAAITDDALVLFAVGLMSVQRLEMWLRARRLLAEAIAAKQAGSKDPPAA